MALAVLMPVAFLLFMLAMERVETYLFPTAPWADRRKRGVEPPDDGSADDAVAPPLERPATP